MSVPRAKGSSEVYCNGFHNGQVEILNGMKAWLERRLEYGHRGEGQHGDAVSPVTREAAHLAWSLLNVAEQMQKTEGRATASYRREGDTRLRFDLAPTTVDGEVAEVWLVGGGAHHEHG